eukprot:2906652-Pleurochrysis_carterae.AAC.2
MLYVLNQRSTRASFGCASPVSSHTDCAFSNIGTGTAPPPDGRARRASIQIFRCARDFSRMPCVCAMQTQVCCTRIREGAR